MDNSIELFLDQDNEIRLDVEVQGNSKSTFHCRLTFSAGNGMDLSFKGIPLGFGEVQVIVPRLDSILHETVCPAALEVIIDDHVFTPMRFNIDFKKSIQVQTAAPQVESKRKLAVTAKILNQAKEEKGLTARLYKNTRPTQKNVEMQRNKKRRKNLIKTMLQGTVSNN